MRTVVTAHDIPALTRAGHLTEVGRVLSSTWEVFDMSCADEKNPQGEVEGLGSTYAVAVALLGQKLDVVARHHTRQPRKEEAGSPAPSSKADALHALETSVNEAIAAHINAALPEWPRHIQIKLHSALRG